MRIIKNAIVGVLALAAAQSFSVERAAAQAAAERVEGILTAVWGDPHPSVRSDELIRFSIAYPGGARAALEVPPQLRNEAIQHAGKRVAVRGVPAAPAGGGSARIAVSAIEPLAAPRAPAAETRRVLYILLKFKDDPQQPHPVKFFKKLTNPLTGSGKIPATINGFFDGVSYGKLKWKGVVAGDKWYTLPKRRTDYASCDANGACFAPVLDLLGDDALALVSGDVDVTAFDNISFVFNNDLDCCAWGGGYSNGAQSWGATWEPPWGQETSTYVHELGHSLGLPHSGWRYQAYDSNHDEMSRGSPAASVTCGKYDSVNFGGPDTSITCTEPGAGYIMAHQNFLGWIPEPNKRAIRAISKKTYAIEPNASPLGGKLKLLIVCIAGKPCDASEPNARFLTVEVKTKAARFDKGVPSEGVVIHDVAMDRGPVSGPCYFNDSSGWAMPFDAVGGDWDAASCSGEGLRNLAYGVGKTFNDAALGVKIEVLSRTAKAYKVRVTKSK